jgi:hypothetical protein
MKTNKIKNILLIIFLFVNITVSFAQAQSDPWSAPPPSFDDDTPDNAPPLPIDEKTGLLVFSGMLMAGFLIVKKQRKSNQPK